jgi:hypothetical protein
MRSLEQKLKLIVRSLGIITIRIPEGNHRMKNAWREDKSRRCPLNYLGAIKVRQFMKKWRASEMHVGMSTTIIVSLF